MGMCFLGRPLRVSTNLCTYSEPIIIVRTVRRVGCVSEGFESTIIDHQSTQFYLDTLPHAGDEFRGNLDSRLSFDLTISTGVTTLRGT